MVRSPRGVAVPRDAKLLVSFRHTTSAPAHYAGRLSALIFSCLLPTLLVRHRRTAIL